MERAEFLGGVQRQLRHLITDPDGVETALAASGDRDGARLATLLRADRGLSASARLAVYANAYFVRIHDCLHEDFGALTSVLGEAAFHDLVKTYLMLHPPSRPSLRHVGAQLAAHLRTEPFAAIFSRRCAYAADLADLEWAIAEAFYAPDAASIGPEVLALLPPEEWTELRFDLTPSLRIIRCAWPVHLVRDHFEAQVAASPGEARLIVADPTQIRVSRHEERVLYRAISPLEATALEAAAAGDPFTAICERVAGAVGDAAAPRVSADLIASWLAAGLIVGQRRTRERA
jgi:hypothetical protein